MDIKFCVSFTELGTVVLFLGDFVMGKNTPQLKFSRAKYKIILRYLIFQFFFCFSLSIFIIYRIIQYFHIFIQNFHLEICVLSINLGVKMIEFGFTPQLFSDGAFLHKGRQILKL